MNATQRDPYQSEEEGWFLTECNKICAFGGRFGCRADLLSTYPEADAKALAFVQRRAREGSAYHIEALMTAQLT